MATCGTIYELLPVNSSVNIAKRGIYDIDDNFDSWFSRINELQDRGEPAYGGPQHWNMPDMLQIGNGGQTFQEYQLVYWFSLTILPSNLA